MATLPDFTLYSRPEYLSDLVERIDRTVANDTVTLMTMVYDPRVPAISALTNSLQRAAARNVQVLLVVDALSFMLAHGARPGPLFYGRTPSSRSAEPYGAIFKELQRLEEQGGHYAIINQPEHALPNPYAGRSHIKLGIINDRVYIPSCNLDNDDHLDLVVGWHDDKTADWLRTLATDIAKAGSVHKALKGRDKRRRINDAMTLFVDAGIPGQSLIYTKALDFIHHAHKSLFITCQYFPGGPTARQLREIRKRGVHITIRFSPPSSHGKQYLGQWAYNLRERSRMPTDFFAGQLATDMPKMHAKLLADSNAALTGSHNYVTMGVQLGTAEIALLVRDTAFAQNSVSKIRDTIQQAQAS